LIDQVPGLLTLHPYWDKLDDALIEDEEIFTLDFCNAYPTFLYRDPTLSVAINIDDDARGAYTFHCESLQHLQWNTGRGHWALKGVGHQFLLAQLFEVYPDALCVWPHRDPVETHASTLAIATVLFDSIAGRHSDWKPFARAWVEGIRTGLDRVLQSPLSADPRIIHLDFREVSSNPTDAVRNVYEKRGIEFTSEFEGRMRTWLEDPSNRSDRYGRYRYSYEPYGLDPGWVREQFADYRRRFDLP
jgi:Sulfotransferase family